jgi:putative SOS response-associated peptidase YedK
MCGRFAQKTPAADLKRHYNTVNAVEYSASYNIAPSQLIISILERNDQREMARMQWGFQPSWAKGAATKPMINARAETVEEKPFFRASFKRKRCIVPASGFFEWHTQTRQPYYFSPREGEFSIAGLWDASHTRRRFALLCPAYGRREYPYGADSSPHAGNPGRGRCESVAERHPGRSSSQIGHAAL